LFSGRREERIVDVARRSVAERRAPTLRASSLALGVLGFEAAAFFVTLDSASPLQFLVFFTLGLLMVALTALVARATERGVYLSVTVFLAMSIFLGGVEYARERSTPKLRAAAVVRTNQKATIGFFIAETPSRVYLGRTLFEDKGGKAVAKFDPGESRIVAIAKDQVTDLAIGPPKDPNDAIVQAQRLADELCHLQIPEKAKAKEGERSVALTPEERAKQEAACWPGE
jgi:hypothetical protein